MKRELIVIPKVKVHPSKIITFNEIHWTPSPPARNNAWRQDSTLITVEKDGKLEWKRVSMAFLNSKRQGNGVLSKQATKRLKLAIEYFLLLNKPNNGKSGNSGGHFDKKITFITLTLPSKQIHTDNEIKSKCLNQFLIEISKYNYVSNYVWRAEYQENGNIHFHILVNKYVCWRDLRYRWNRIINKLGYVDRYQENMIEFHKNGFQVRADLLQKWTLKQQLQAYQNGIKTNWSSPNSTDIHSISLINNIKSYLTKYLTKQTQELKENLNGQLEEKTGIGRSWGASVIISNIKGATTEIDSKLEENLRTLENHFPNQVYKSDYFTVIDIDLSLIESVGCDGLLFLFRDYLFKQFRHSSQLTIQRQ